MCKSLVCAMRRFFMLDRRREPKPVPIERRQTPSHEADKRLLESIDRLEQSVKTCIDKGLGK